MLITEKLYYSDPFLTECMAIIIDKRNGNEICLDKTVAFPEGGGQISDIGHLFFENESVAFHDVKKGIGRVLSVSDFPTINVDTPVYHIINSEDFDKLHIGQEVTVKVDVNRRIWTTLHHSAIHLALMFATQIDERFAKSIKGCSITESSARLDFFRQDKITSENIDYINENLKAIINSALPIEVYQYDGENEAWFWKCLDFSCPCGGTHVTNTKQIGQAVARRKGLGKGSERLVVTVENPILSPNDYHTLTQENIV